MSQGGGGAQKLVEFRIIKCQKNMQKIYIPFKVI